MGQFFRNQSVYGYEQFPKIESTTSRASPRGLFTTRALLTARFNTSSAILGFRLAGKA